MVNLKTFWRLWILVALLTLAPAVGAQAAEAPAVSPPRPALTTTADPEPLVKLPAAGPLRITLAGAVVMALENNRALVLEQLNPHIRQTQLDQERAVFDPLAAGQIDFGHMDEKQLSGSSLQNAVEENSAAVFSLQQLFPTGTTVALEAGAEISDSSLYRDPFTSSALGISVTQALLRGFGAAVNTARLRQAEIDVEISGHELQGFSQALVARVEAAYWDSVMAGRQVEIVKESLRVAEQQLAETQQTIAVGTLAEAELPAVQAEVALERQALIGAQADFESLRLELLRLISPPDRSFWDREVDLVVRPEVPEIRLDPVADHVALALRMRPEIHQARLEIQRGELQIVQTRNGLLPRLDLFVSLGKTGFADAFSGAVEDMDGRHYDFQAGISFAYPPGNRDAEARHLRARLEKRQAEAALANLAQLVELDVRRAYIDVDRTRQQIAASTATRQLQKEKNRIELEKFRVGRSTSFLVAQAQRDLLSSRIAEVQAVVDYLKALTELFRLDGSLLARRGLVVSDGQPFEAAADPLHLRPRD